MSRSSGTARFWFRTICPAPSIASGMTANSRRMKTGAAGKAAPIARRQPMTWSRPALAVACAVIGATSAVADGNVMAGRQKALQCQACHGLDGQAKIPDAPNLAGQTEIYLAKSMKDYRR